MIVFSRAFQTDLVFSIDYWRIEESDLSVLCSECFPRSAVVGVDDSEISSCFFAEKGRVFVVETLSLVPPFFSGFDSEGLSRSWFGRLLLELTI